MSDTICAISTAAGQGGVGIVRISGPQALELGSLICQKASLKPRFATRAQFGIGTPIDDGIALYFPGPNSFTGEDVVELQGHGSPIALNALLQALCEQGARLAEPGEFSKRAFLNDQLDLAQAEAISDLIAANSERAARSAVRALRGEFSTRIETLAKAMIELRVWVEAALDFPEEEIDFLADEALAARLDHVRSLMDDILAKATQGALLRNGAKVVLMGRPNAGKSSLLNYLADEELAIVTDIPGTTRDLLSTQINLHGVPLHITDTAGLRETTDPVEQEGVRRARKALSEADLAILIADINSPEHMDELSEELGRDYPQVPILKVFNKLDQLETHVSKKQDLFLPLDPSALQVSIKQAIGLEQLKDQLAQLVGIDQSESDVFIARTRHLDALRRARQHFDWAEAQLLQYAAGELMAEELLQAHHALGEITGKLSADDLLGEIFSSFCIGK
ncbi:MAG: tRNA uridine-5-carboxymethylaminomethyl(34) synthesis GTPase MnmE [Gammaproteobacteria bacterium]|nr:tRNA uridine-5-carboxymethylaminomethyl(34) synthesis GTPase MnmE [Gammaproteobacteria bacterium]